LKNPSFKKRRGKGGGRGLKRVVNKPVPVSWLLQQSSAVVVVVAVESVVVIVAVVVAIVVVAAAEERLVVKGAAAEVDTKTNKTNQIVATR